MRVELAAEVEFGIGDLVTLDTDAHSPHPPVYRVAAHVLTQARDAGGEARTFAEAAIETVSSIGYSQSARVTAARLRPVPKRVAD